MQNILIQNKEKRPLAKFVNTLQYKYNQYFRSVK